MAIDIGPVLDVCGEAGDLDDLMRSAIGSLRRLMPFDACGFRVLDPDTMLWTGGYVEGPPAIMWRFIENEILDDDFLKFTDLARGRGVGTLFSATGGKPERSRRYRTILRHAGLRDEMRAALVSRNVCWGTLCLSRAEDAELFAHAERDVVAGLAPRLAQAVCRRFVSQRPGPPPDGPPGTVLVRADGTIMATTTAAESWLADLGHFDDGALPPVARGVVARARVQAPGDGGLPAFARARGVKGDWFELHGAPLIDTPELVSLTIAPAPIARIAPLLLASFELSEREQEVLVLMLRGYSNEQIGRELFISRYTVGDHIKAIFAKTNVSSRNQLLALLLADAEPLIG